MATWYSVNKYRYHNHPFIEPVEVDRATEMSVWVGGKRRERMGERVCYFPTFVAAKEFLVQRERIKVEDKKVDLAMAEKDLKAAMEQECPLAGF